MFLADELIRGIFAYFLVGPIFKEKWHYKDSWLN